MGTNDTPGWDGMYYRYGYDYLVNLKALQKNCEKEWVWVNFDGESKKRSLQDLNITIQIIAPVTGADIQSIDDFIVQTIDRDFEAKVENGMDTKEALRELATEACQSVSTIEITDYVQEWLDMNGLSGDEFRRVCDTTDISWFKVLPERLFSKLKVSSVSAIPNWTVILFASGFVFVFVIAVVVILIILKKNRDNPMTTNK